MMQYAEQFETDNYDFIIWGTMLFPIPVQEKLLVICYYF